MSQEFFSFLCLFDFFSRFFEIPHERFKIFCDLSASRSEEHLLFAVYT